MRKNQRSAEGKAAAFFIYPIDQEPDKALFSPGEIYFTSALRFYVGEVSAAGNGWLIHRQMLLASACCTSDGGCGKELRGFRAPGGPARGGGATGATSLPLYSYSSKYKNAGIIQDLSYTGSALLYSFDID